jgi:REP element-mobilizing transposase RayT
MAEGYQLAGAVAGVSPTYARNSGVRHFWARGYLAASSGTITDEMIREYIDEQEGEQIIDDSRFPIDNP